MLSPASVRRYAPICLASLVLAFAFASAGLASPIVFLDIGGQGSSATTTVGSTLGVTVKASDIPVGSDTAGMFGFGFRVGYDGSGLDASDLTIDSLWTGMSSTDDGAGSAGMIGNRFGETSGPSGDDILLGTFDFEVLQAGTFVLTLSHFTGVGDNILFDTTLLDTAGSYFGSGSITALPEPGSGALLVAGLGFLMSRRSRRRPGA